MVCLVHLRRLIKVCRFVISTTSVHWLDTELSLNSEYRKKIWVAFFQSLHALPLALIPCQTLHLVRLIFVHACLMLG